MPELSDENRLRLKELLNLLTPEQIRALSHLTSEQMAAAGVVLACLPSDPHELRETIEGICEVSAHSEGLARVSAVSRELAEISALSPEISEIVERHRRYRKNRAEVWDLVTTTATFLRNAAYIVGLVWLLSKALWPGSVPPELPNVPSIPDPLD